MTLNACLLKYLSKQSALTSADVRVPLNAFDRQLDELPLQARFRWAIKDTSDSNWSCCQKLFYLNWVTICHLYQTSTSNHYSCDPSFCANIFKVKSGPSRNCYFTYYKFRTALPITGSYGTKGHITTTSKRVTQNRATSQVMHARNILIWIWLLMQGLESATIT